MAWDLLFTSDIGLFSLFVIAFTIGMSVFFARFFRKKMDEDAAKPPG
ncbi:DUF3149 domain-containing protein [Rhodocyclus tenuis]|uniref:DUF3149 domain-containing protein n=1 Tax=Rhodocyclus tenuis TaxID=1066 RepID=A0A840FXA2_RHOTE|nr:DUF3149 domain-containing protein [Rhodocyclus tenuis]MBB4246727.1 hypothetical protein [Rhodocyclus tenuis]MBK1680021.1 hypothetical protein [Rhodocyclus tenuis]